MPGSEWARAIVGAGEGLEARLAFRFGPALGFQGHEVGGTMVKPVGTLCILAMCLLTISCKKLDQPSVAGPLTFEPAKFVDAIPNDYGTVIGVTQNPRSSAWVTLWFQRPDRTITAVFVNIEQGRIYEKALTIPRK